MGELSEVVNGRDLNSESSISARSSKHNRVRDMLAATLLDSVECKVDTEVEILAGRIDVVMEAENKKFAFEVKTGTSNDNIKKSYEQCVNYYRHGYYPVLVLTVNLLSELDEEEIQIIKDSVLDVGAELLIYDRYFNHIPAFKQIDTIIPQLDTPSCYNCGDMLLNLGDYYACVWCEEHTPTVPIVPYDVIDMLRWAEQCKDLAPMDAGFGSIRDPNEPRDRQGMSGIGTARDNLYGDDN
jgi:hypothetical protein